MPDMVDRSVIVTDKQNEAEASQAFGLSPPIRLAIQEAIFFPLKHIIHLQRVLIALLVLLGDNDSQTMLNMLVLAQLS